MLLDRKLDEYQRSPYLTFSIHLDADLQSYFDTIPKQGLMELVKARVSDVNVLKLLQQFLNQKLVERMKHWTPVAGTPQGSVISSLLANLYLHGLDEMHRKEGYRYAVLLTTLW